MTSQLPNERRLKLRVVDRYSSRKNLANSTLRNRDKIHSITGQMVSFDDTRRQKIDMPPLIGVKQQFHDPLQNTLTKFAVGHKKNREINSLNNSQISGVSYSQRVSPDFPNNNSFENMHLEHPRIFISKKSRDSSPDNEE